VPPSQGSSAAGAPELPGALTTTTAVVTAAGSRSMAPAASRGAPGLTAEVSVVTPLVKAGGA
jgi:hypothetical protein